jgi:hypothetical protein
MTTPKFMEFTDHAGDKILVDFVTSTVITQGEEIEGAKLVRITLPDGTGEGYEIKESYDDLKHKLHAGGMLY